MSVRSTNKLKRTPRLHNPFGRLGAEELENRCVPTVAVNVVNGLLDLKGTGNDAIAVNLDAAQQNYLVLDNGATVATVPVGNVDRLRVQTGVGVNSVAVDPAVLVRATLLGGPGTNQLAAGGGPTTIVAGAGDDTLTGGAGKTRLVAGPGNDTLLGGAGSTTFLAGNGNAIMQGGAGDGRFYGGPGQVQEIGGTGRDTFFGGAGPTTVTPGPNDPPLPAAAALPPSSFNLANFQSTATESTLTLGSAEVDQLLQRASAASASNDAIIAIVDRTGRILGVRVEAGVDAGLIADPAKLSFAIDGALAEARTGAFFANNAAPLTSRTVQFVSQSTITQREVDSSPDVLDPNSTLRGPGFVAPIEIGGHFPPVSNTPSANLFDIEHTNRDRGAPAGADGIAGTADDPVVNNVGRFSIPLGDYAPGKALQAPLSFGEYSGLFPNGQSRGIGTLPGGVGIYKNGQVVGGIGVFFPGKTGYASEENSSLSADYNPAKPDRTLEAEWMAYAAVGGSGGAGFSIGTIGGVAALPGFDLPFGRIDVDGITVPIFGPLVGGAGELVRIGRTFGTGDPNSAAAGLPAAAKILSRDGVAPPNGWIVPPKNASDGSITAADVQRMVANAVAEAIQTRGAIRTPLNTPSAMVIAVSDNAGNVIGLYRMPDATFFSVDVAVAKSRNVSYYSRPTGVDPLDGVDVGANGSALPAGTATTNRTFRYLALPFFPEGVDDSSPGPFSVLNDGQADPKTGLNKQAPLPSTAFQSVAGHDAFDPGTNFHDPRVAQGKTNGIVFFPGSAPVYKDADRTGVRRLSGGLGVSGDGVDQDDVVTSAGIIGYEPATAITADQYMVRGVRLPYAKFPRNPTTL